MPPRKPNFVGANSPRPALSATAIAIFRARDLTIPAISSRTFSGSNCLPDVFLFLRFTGFFSVFLLVLDFLPFRFFFIIPTIPDFLMFYYFPQNAEGAPCGYHYNGGYVFLIF